MQLHTAREISFQEMHKNARPPIEAADSTGQEAATNEQSSFFLSRHLSLGMLPAAPLALALPAENLRRTFANALPSTARLLQKVTRTSLNKNCSPSYASYSALYLVGIEQTRDERHCSRHQAAQHEREAHEHERGRECNAVFAQQAQK